VPIFFKHPNLGCHDGIFSAALLVRVVRDQDC
jgi:hypothetical protein